MHTVASPPSLLNHAPLPPSPQPENVLIDGKGFVKIADLGYAKLVRGQRTFSTLGTVNYAPPELVKGRGRTKAADWWGEQANHRGLAPSRLMPRPVAPRLTLRPISLNPLPLVPPPALPPLPGCGVLLHEMIRGEAPFVGDTSDDVLARVRMYAEDKQGSDEMLRRLQVGGGAGEEEGGGGAGMRLGGGERTKGRN